MDSGQDINVLFVDTGSAQAAGFEKTLSSLPALSFLKPVGACTGFDDALKNIVSKKAELVFLCVGTSGVDTENLRKISSLVPLVLCGSDSDLLSSWVVLNLAHDWICSQSPSPTEILKAARYAMERFDTNRRLFDYETRLKGLGSQVDDLRRTDPLTGLLNRYGAQEALGQKVSRMKRRGSELFVMLIDIDNFRNVNEKFGHSTGDSILRSFAQALRSMLRKTDALARIATDEFLVFLPETRVAEGLQVAETLRAKIEAMEFDAGGLMKVSLTFSAGAVTVSPETETLDALVPLLGPALRISKNYGKNRVTFGNEKQENYQASHYQLQTIIEEFRLADPFFAVKQPIVDMKTGDICAYELLVRSNTQFNLPDDLFALSRKADMLSLVDRKCFSVCCAASRTIPSHYRVHLNIFPITLLDLPPAKIIELLPRERPFENYCIEISEQQFVGLPFDIVEPLRELKKDGCLVALDDVGFGYSCLETLVMIAPDIIKIDKKMITGIAFDEGRRRMLERLLCVMSSLESVIVAEGIESEDDARVVRELGIEEGQGYFYGRPEK